ncbi:MarR family winged helix-turn-helix transcriptional regulator [Virgisporangium aliadipatigenens]|uniref:MarR family winged helix-turn-helix transcriptional regulator n=1 Tax=Virgisporangium aliadipatigenens TaxID=741659 RepID=UPI0019458C1B|nr:MarR family winged helix-turn-helix transcriptional regulator [Virgisporangium aliadipatigenens]
MHASSRGAGPALFHLVRYWSRRWAPGVAAGTDSAVQDILVVEAVAASAAGADIGERAVTVTDVAEQLGLDRSGASRLVSAAVAHGYVARAAAGGDARRAALTVTPAGAELLAAAHAWQDGVFAELTAGWKADDVRRLAGYLRRLAAANPP